MTRRRFDNQAAASHRQSGPLPRLALGRRLPVQGLDCKIIRPAMLRTSTTIREQASSDSSSRMNWERCVKHDAPPANGIGPRYGVVLAA